MVIDQLTNNDLLQKISAVMVWVESSNNDSISSFCAVETQKKLAELKREILLRIEKSSGWSHANEKLLDNFLKAAVRIINTNSRTVQNRYWKVKAEILSKMTNSPLQKQKTQKTAKKKN